MIKSNKIVLGSAQFGLDYGISNNSGKIKKEEVGKIVNFSNNNNINFIDTAPIYGNAEQILGTIGVDNFNVISKFTYKDNCKIIEKDLLFSLKNLKINNLYAYLAHIELDLLEDGVWETLQDLKSRGLIAKAGVSLYSLESLNKILQANIVPDIIQVPYNIIDNRFESIMKYLKKTGCEIHSRSTFLQGIFFMNLNSLPSFFNEIKPIISHIQLENKNISSYLLNYVCEKEFIDKVIIGVENVLQLSNNLKYLHHSYKYFDFKLKINEKIKNPSLWPKIK
jgi:aryl-alcohol dehydrogenase-like predicted oxidoreductase